MNRLFWKVVTEKLMNQDTLEEYYQWHLEPSWLGKTLMSLGLLKET